MTADNELERGRPSAVAVQYKLLGETVKNHENLMFVCPCIVSIIRN